MSLQLTIDGFFKSKSFTSQMDGKKSGITKKRSLSLKKPVTPTKSPRVNCADKSISDSINLCSSDDENENSTPNSKSSTSTSNSHGPEPILASGEESNLSQTTVIYSLSPTITEANPLTARSPRQPQTPSSVSFRIKSPGSINKYFSPGKKRVLTRKTPVKRNLGKEWENGYSSLSVADDLFQEACNGLDDKTIFLLDIINKFVKNVSLKCLLNEQSQQLLEKCMYIKKPGMRLVCRLFWFKNGWYKQNKVRSILFTDNREIDDVLFNEVLKSLLESGLIKSSVCDGGIQTFEDYSSILDSNDMKQICKDLKLKISNKKSAIEALRKYCRQSSIGNFYTGSSNNNAKRVLKIMAAKAGMCYKLSECAKRAIHKLYVLMYLGIDYTLIRDKKLELTLKWDNIKIETYPIEGDILDSASVVFKSSEEFERYVQALITYEHYIEETNVNKKCDMVTSVYHTYKNYTEEELMRYKSIPSWLRRFTPLNFYIKILDLAIIDLKKDCKYTLVLDILSSLISQESFRQHKKAEWYGEKALVLHKEKQSDLAAQVLLEAFKTDLNEEDKDILRNRAKILAKNTSQENIKMELLGHAEKENILEKELREVHIFKQPMDRLQSKGKLKYETRTLDGLVVQDVEDFCLSHYIQSGEFNNGKHWEGRIVTTMFFLLFWDIIYVKPPNCTGIFLCRYQRYPLDMFSESFYSNRKEFIDERLQRLESMPVPKILEIMKEIWTSRPEGEHSGLVREGVSWEEVGEVASCLGGRGLAALCARLARDYRYSHSGFPDLTLWNSHTKKIRFVEVKSSSDKPSIKQIQWMHYLQKHGIDTEFCYVGATLRKKSQAKTQ